VALPELTGLIFTGGIGENAALIREKTVARLHQLGLHLDPLRNQHAARGQEARLERADSRTIWVIPTDEESRIAQETRQVLGLDD
jgi:acetate kinase